MFIRMCFFFNWIERETIFYSCDWIGAAEKGFHHRTPHSLSGTYIEVDRGYITCDSF